MDAAKFKALKEKYPSFDICHTPLRGCPGCEGLGEYLTQVNSKNLCYCTCSRSNDSTRRRLVEELLASFEKNKVLSLSKKVD